MNFGLFFANAGPFSDPATFEALVRSADETGFESIWTVEHVVVPVGYESRYPYSPSGRMPGPESAPIPDPLVALSYAAAISKRLRLATGIVILPQRHPVYVAKEFASLDLLSGGRAILGVGIGWLEEEFRVVGVPFRERAARTEESVRAIRSLWKDEPEAFEGRFYRWPPVQSNPKPVQKPGVPIVVGGHVEGAARRAARIGDGFFPANSEVGTLTGLLDALRDECGKVGRDPAQIEITTTSGGTPDLDAVRRYEDLGVSRLAIFPPAFDAEGLRRGLSDFAESVIARA
jgi:probable F420-dependent oxidoreductase